MSDSRACLWYQRETITTNAKSSLATHRTQCPWVGVGRQTIRNPGQDPVSWGGGGGGGTTLPPLKCPQAQSRLLHTLPTAPSKAGSQKVLVQETNKEMNHDTCLLVPPLTCSKHMQVSSPAKHSPDACYQALAEALWSLVKHFRRLFH